MPPSSTGGFPVLHLVLVGGAPSRDFERYLRRLLRAGPRILDIGTPRRFAKELAPYESLFAGTEYIAAGYQPELGHGAYNCDRHEDVESMTFGDGTFDGVICLEVLEHVKRPWNAAAELIRVLRPGGALLLTTPFLYPYHGKGGASQSHGEYPDLWRLTHQGLSQLFADLREREIVPLDGPIEARIRLSRLWRWVANPVIRAFLDRFDPRELGRLTTRHLLFGVR